MSNPIDDPGLYRALAAAVLTKSLRDLEANNLTHRRMARAWWLMPDNPHRELWVEAAGMDEDAMLDSLRKRGLLEPGEE